MLSHEFVQMDGIGLSKYMINRYGEIRNTFRGSYITQSLADGHVRVKLRDDYGRDSMYSVRKLVAEIFVSRPDPSFDRVVQKDGNPQNLNADNLAWRSRSYATQYRLDQESPVAPMDVPIHDITADIHYTGIREVSMALALTYRDIIRTIDYKEPNIEGHEFTMTFPVPESPYPTPSPAVPRTDDGQMISVPIVTPNDTADDGYEIDMWGQIYFKGDKLRRLPYEFKHELNHVVGLYLDHEKQYHMKRFDMADLVYYSFNPNVSFDAIAYVDGRRRNNLSNLFGCSYEFSAEYHYQMSGHMPIHHNRGIACIEDGLYFENLRLAAQYYRLLPEDLYPLVDSHQPLRYDHNSVPVSFYWYKTPFKEIRQWFQ